MVRTAGEEQGATMTHGKEKGAPSRLIPAPEPDDLLTKTH